MLPTIEVHVGRYAHDWGRNALNSAFHVEIAEHVQGSFIGILAQEVYESRFKLLLLPIFPVARLPWVRERMELMGHAIECAAAVAYEGANLEAYEVTEAFALTDRASSYYAAGMFRGWTIHRVTGELAKRRAKARRWVESNHQLLDHWHLWRLQRLGQ